MRRCNQIYVVTLYTNAQRSLNIVANYLTREYPIRTFCCQYHNKALYFVVVLTVDNKRYVRHRQAAIKIPEHGHELQHLLKSIHLVFGRRDGVVELARNLEAARPLGASILPDEIYFETTPPPRVNEVVLDIYTTLFLQAYHNTFVNFMYATLLRRHNFLDGCLCSIHSYKIH
ncbi:predicted protein [Lichtheimia corymbifera JMRC:FSU:9682]|uniref:Uncharacterized protein n=1 Tax=Lichtheimia corymbifera JMRC:FSU:9682 TaxID=1263082 RepID=A0A068RSX2_9FUNG|nr:predicted protein [Lichtheimia corymbifera JMRC:FSU:9682]